MAFADASTPRIYITVTRKINLGNYESAEVSMGISNLDFDTPDGDVDDALARTEELSCRLRERMRIEVAKIRHEHKQGM